jgi:hypothetical protein
MFIVSAFSRMIDMLCGARIFLIDRECLALVLFSYRRCHTRFVDLFACEGLVKVAALWLPVSICGSACFYDVAQKNALEPHISAQTLDFHYGKHHQTYVTNLNNLVKGTEWEKMTLEEIITKAPAGGIFNNAAQIWNHTFYWHCLSPKVVACLADAARTNAM